MAKNEQAEHKLIAALRADLEKAKKVGGAISEAMKWSSDSEPEGPCLCSEAEALRAELAETKRQLLEAHRDKDRATDFLDDLFDTMDAYRSGKKK